MSYRTLSPEQALLRHDILNPSVPIVQAVGPYGSGKTATALPDTLTFFTLYHTGRQGALITAGRDAMTAMIEEELLPWAAHHAIPFEPRKNGWQIGNNFLWQVIGADRRSYRRLKGRNLAVVFCDETTEIPESLHSQAHDRLRIDPVKFVGATNPDSPNHWLKRYNDRHRVAEHILPLWANPRQSAEYVRRQIERHSGADRDRYVFGRWAVGPLSAYPFLEDCLAPMPTDWPVKHCGLAVDVGQAVPTHALLFAHGTLGQVWCMAEWRHDPRDSGTMRPRDQCEQIAEWADGIAPAPIVQGIVDNAEFAFQDILDMKMLAAGHKVDWRVTPKLPINQGIKVVSRKMVDTTFFIDGDECPHLIDEAGSLEMYDIKLERGEEESDPYQEDHGPDALRYYIVHIVMGM